jgi:hypothetical protein
MVTFMPIRFGLSIDALFDCGMRILRMIDRQDVHATFGLSLLCAALLFFDRLSS